MKQNVNLYQPATSSNGSLNSRAIVFAWGITVVVVAVTQFWLGHRGAATANEVGQARLDLAAAEERLSSMTATMMAGADPELESRLGKALRELDLRETILGLVSGDSAGNISGFSGQLRSLARQHAEGVWLTRVRLSSPGTRTTLEGRALSPEAVPLYLRQLSGEAALAGQSFDVFEIERPEKAGEAIRFSMNRRNAADSVQFARE